MGKDEEGFVAKLEAVERWFVELQAKAVQRDEKLQKLVDKLRETT